MGVLFGIRVFKISNNNIQKITCYKRSVHYMVFIYKRASSTSSFVGDNVVEHTSAAASRESHVCTPNALPIRSTYVH